MRQQGSKYDPKTKEEALALVASGVSITNAACRMNIPKSTLADWVHTQWDADEDAAAARREARRASIRKCGRIVDKALGALDRKVAAAGAECRQIDEGLKTLRRAAADGVIGLEAAEVDRLREIVDHYTGSSLRELAGTMKDVAAQQQSLERQMMDAPDAAPEVQVRLTLVDPAKEGQDEP